MTASRGLSTTAPSMGFAPSWHMRSQKVRSMRAVPDSPPAVLRVSCHPLDGFLPFAPCQPCFRPTAPSGFSLRSLLLAEVEPAFLPIFAPHAVASGLASTSLLDSAKLGACRSTPGYCLGRIPCIRFRCLARPDAGCSLGFCSSQGSSSIRPDQLSPADLLSHAWFARWLPIRRPCVTECCRQFDLSNHRGRMSLSGFLHLSIPGVRASIR
jgi:hypothetical protein